MPSLVIGITTPDVLGMTQAWWRQRLTGCIAYLLRGPVCGKHAAARDISRNGADAPGGGHALQQSPCSQISTWFLCLHVHAEVMCAAA